MGDGGGGQEIFRVIYDDGNRQRRDALVRIVQRRETVLGESDDYFYHYDADGHAYRVISDNLGSVRLVVSLDATTLGQVAQRLDYDEFGVVLTDTAPGFQPFGFAEGIQDDCRDQKSFGHRDYSTNCIVVNRQAHRRIATSNDRNLEVRL